MPILTCPDCQSQISSLAPSCPKCGRPQDAANSTERKVGVLLAIGIVLCPLIFSWFTLRKGHTSLSRAVSLGWLILVIVISATDTEQATESRTENIAESKPIKSGEETEPEFSFTLDQYIERYNRSCDTLQSKIRLRRKSSNDNGSFLTTQFDSNRNVALVANSNRETNKLQSLIFIASGDGTVESGVDVLLGSVAIVMAVENPEMSTDTRTKILSDLAFIDNENKDKDNVEFIRNGVKYTKTYSTQIGTMLAATPIK